MKDFFLDWFAGPKLMETISRVKSAGSKVSFPASSHPPKQLSVDGYLDFRDTSLSVSDSVVWVPTLRIRNLYSAAFTPEQNPLVRYLNEGLESLCAYYKVHTPQNTFEAHFLDSSGNEQFPQHRRIWPWSPFALDLPKHAEIANNWVGPASPPFCKQVARKLDKLSLSISRKGYIVSADSPKFIILVDDRLEDCHDFSFVIQGGNHRTAVMSYLGWDAVPMSPLPTAGSVEVRLSQLEQWPGVRDGTFSLESAERLFLAFFRRPNQVLLPKW